MILADLNIYLKNFDWLLNTQSKLLQADCLQQENISNVARYPNVDCTTNREHALVQAHSFLTLLYTGTPIAYGLSYPIKSS